MLEENNYRKHEENTPIDLNFDSYIVLDMPSPIKEQVMEIRKIHREIKKNLVPKNENNLLYYVGYTVFNCKIHFIQLW